jgi:hypothetical protein
LSFSEASGGLSKLSMLLVEVVQFLAFTLEHAQADTQVVVVFN